MQALLIAFLGKAFEILLKYLIAWGEKSIAKQLEIKRKMEAYKASQEAEKIKAEAYEKDPSNSNANDLP